MAHLGSAEVSTHSIAGLKSVAALQEREQIQSKNAGWKTSLECTVLKFLMNLRSK